MDNARDLLDRLLATERDLAARDAVTAQQRTALAKREPAIADCDASIVRLHAQSAALHRLFRAGAERRTPANKAANETVLIFAEIRAAAERVAAARDVQARIRAPALEHKSPRRRDAFPPHLPRIQTRSNLPEYRRACSCGGDLVDMGGACTGGLERLATAWIHETVRTKYYCQTCREHVTTAPGQKRVCDTIFLGTSFVAHVPSERFAPYMPCRRQEKKYASEGLPLSRTVFCDGVRRAADLLDSIGEAQRQFLEDGRISVDYNTAEYGIRGVALGPENWLFFGTDEGGRQAALIFGLVDACRAADISFRDWLCDVLVRIAAATEVRCLLPHAWRGHFLPEVLVWRDTLLSRLGLTSPPGRDPASGACPRATWRSCPNGYCSGTTWLEAVPRDRPPLLHRFPMPRRGGLPGSHGRERGRPVRVAHPLDHRR